MMLIRIDKKLKVCKITTFYKNRDNKDNHFVTVFPFFYDKNYLRKLRMVVSIKTEEIKN